MIVPGCLDVNVMVLLHLDLKTLSSVFRVNKRYAEIGRSEHFWKQLLKRDFIQLTVMDPKFDKDANQIETRSTEILKSKPDFFTTKFTWKLAYQYIDTIIFMPVIFEDQRIGYLWTLLTLSQAEDRKSCIDLLKRVRPKVDPNDLEVSGAPTEGTHYLSKPMGSYIIHRK